MTAKSRGNKKARNPKQAAKALRKNGFTVREPKTSELPKPLVVPGLHRALRDVRGKSGA